MISNNIIEKPITISDIRGLLGVSSYDLGTLCSSNKVNMWSKHKPIRNNRPFLSESEYITAAIAKNYGLSMPYYRSNTNSCIIDMAKAIADGSALWGYEKPRQEYGECFRIGDFHKYCHRTNWDEGVEPGVPSVINFPLCIAVQAGNNEGMLEKGQILRMYNQGIDLDDINEYSLSTTDLLDCTIGDNTIDSMRIGIALIPYGVTPTYDNIQVFLSNVRISAIDDDTLVYEMVTNIGTVISGQEYYVVPFLYYGLQYADGPKPTSTVALQKVVKSPDISGYACVSMIGNKTYTRTAVMITPASISANLVVNTNAVATIYISTGSEAQKFSYMFIVICSEAMSQYDYINDTEVPYPNASHYFLMKDLSALNSIGIADGCGNITINSKAEGTTLSGVVTVSEATPVRYKSGSDTSTTFGWAIDAKLALGELAANKTYSLKVTFPKGAISDSGGTVSDIMLFTANRDKTKYEVHYL